MIILLIIDTNEKANSFSNNKLAANCDSWVIFSSVTSLKCLKGSLLKEDFMVLNIIFSF